MNYSINVNGRLIETDTPRVMGILNVTPDSFFERSRVSGEEELVERAQSMLADGADILDVGACSTRPSGEPVSEEEELARLHAALDVLDKHFPSATVSVDTFRARVAQECAELHNVAIINDVSGFEWDENMLHTVARLNLPYVLTHSAGWAGTPVEYDDFLPQVLASLAKKVWQLRQLGVKDVIVDPGFGFGKSVAQNYEMLSSLDAFAELEAPLLVGLSRKSMITTLLGISSGEALPETSALNMAALLGGAHILRVHDVREAANVVKMFMMLKGV
ncbi:MAG: dihydropteroate synthase [Bacteroidaceae bacterium]|nr:dihydropteroate synthase [Bacteroidaceae bacterium]